MGGSNSTQAQLLKIVPILVGVKITGYLTSTTFRQGRPLQTKGKLTELPDTIGDTMQRWDAGYFHATTISCGPKGDEVAIWRDGQVTLGKCGDQQFARKIRIKLINE